MVPTKVLTRRDWTCWRRLGKACRKDPLTVAQTVFGLLACAAVPAGNPQLRRFQREDTRLKDGEWKHPQPHGTRPLQAECADKPNSVL